MADTGYGQGQVLMTPLHLALTYAPIVNEGNIPSPHLIKDDKQVKPWKENVISKGNQDILKNALTKVINDEDGTGKIAKVDGMTLAGKTGTAELKESKEAARKEKAICTSSAVKSCWKPIERTQARDWRFCSMAGIGPQSQPNGKTWKKSGKPMRMRMAFL